MRCLKHLGEEEEEDDGRIFLKHDKDRCGVLVICEAEQCLRAGTDTPFNTEKGISTKPEP